CASLDPITIAPPSHWLPSKPIAVAGFWTRCITPPRSQCSGSHGSFEVYARMAEVQLAEVTQTKEGWDTCKALHCCPLWGSGVCRPGDAKCPAKRAGAREVSCGSGGGTCGVQSR